jgi:hypothetical protein
VADFTSGLQVIDISDPTSPVLAGAYDAQVYAYGVAVSGDHAFVASYGGGLQVIDISDPTNPALAGSCNTPGYAIAVAVSGDRAFVSDGDSGLQVIDISDPINPTLAGSYDTPGEAMGVAVSGGHAFVADQLSGLQVVNVSDPISPALAGGYDTPSDAHDVTVSGNRAFVADYASGLQVIDISDPANPTITSAYDTPGYALGVTVLGHYAFVADWDFGLQVISISDPANPTLSGSYDTPGTAIGVTVSGDYAFVADWDFGLQVIDILDPTNPTLAGSCDTPGSASGVTVSGDHAFVADRAFGLQVIDISDPANPTLTGNYDTAGSNYAVAVAGDHAFAACQIFGLQVIDISVPNNPTFAGSYNTPGYAAGVTISGDHAFVADGPAGLQVIDISNPANPTLVGGYDTPIDALGITVAGDHALLANSLSGLYVIRAFQSDVDTDYNTGRSLVVHASSDTIIAARLTTTQTNTVAWELSADGGTNWDGIPPDGGWHQMSVAGNDLLWRSTHSRAAAGVNPTVSRVEISVLYQFPIIVASQDIPNDQGGYVLLEWDRSGYDAYDLRAVTHYSVWRALHTTPSQMPVGMEDLLCTPADIHKTFEGPAIRAEGGYYWEWLTNVTAQYFDGYAYAAPTYYDSIGGDPAMHYFQVIAHTSDQWTFWTSYPDSGYSVDNLAPGVPQGFSVAYNTGSGNALSWEESEDEDFQHFRVYRSTTPDFDPTPDDLVATTADVSWNDPHYDGWPVHYKITAVDFAGNESDAASPGTATGVTDLPTPTAFALGQNVPNPFNPTTTIHYEVPAGGGVVTLRVYDVSGRLVRTLVDGFEESGVKSVVWNGRDDRGHGVSSGVYFYRMDAPGFSQTRKMLLLQ